MESQIQERQSSRVCRHLKVSQQAYAAVEELVTSWNMQRARQAECQLLADQLMSRRRLNWLEDGCSDSCADRHQPRAVQILSQVLYPGCKSSGLCE